MIFHSFVCFQILIQIDALPCIYVPFSRLVLSPFLSSFSVLLTFLKSQRESLPYKQGTSKFVGMHLLDWKEPAFLGRLATNEEAFYDGRLTRRSCSKNVTRNRWYRPPDHMKSLLTSKARADRINWEGKIRSRRSYIIKLSKKKKSERNIYKQQDWRNNGQLKLVRENEKTTTTLGDPSSKSWGKREKLPPRYIYLYIHMD